MRYLSINHTVIKTIIFDFDGTLAKLNIDFDQMRRVIRELIICYGIDHQVLQNKHVLEIIKETESLLMKYSHQKAESFIKESYRLIEAIEVDAAHQGELFDYTRELLKGLASESIQVGVITRNCTIAVHTVFPDIAAYCPVVICRDDVKHVKPHPEQINLALSRLGAVAGSSLMVGDHPLDIETGHNAGILAAGVQSGHYSRDDFFHAGADMVFTRAHDIINLMR